VALAARNAQRLEETAKRCRNAGGEALVVPTDVADESAVTELVHRAKDAFGRIDAMVNNAGYGIHARMHETTPEQMRRIFDVNVFGLFYGCRAVAPIMIDQGGGHIFNISSVLGKRGSPFNGAYSATKHAVVGMSDSLRVELAPAGVRVTCVCPGLTDTEFFDRAEGPEGRQKNAFRALRTMQSPEHVARTMVRFIGRDKPEMIFTPGGKLLVWVAAVSPRAADWMMRIYHDRVVSPAKTF
jgi:short-subunit dehydrogenase